MELITKLEELEKSKEELMKCIKKEFDETRIGNYLSLNQPDWIKNFIPDDEKNYHILDTSLRRGINRFIVKNLK